MNVIPVRVPNKEMNAPDSFLEEFLPQKACAGTAVQEDPDRPAFSGNGPNDYVCVKCGNVLAEAMDPMYMTKKVRVRCGVVTPSARSLWASWLVRASSSL